MKIALIAAGQPRFTPDFITFMHQLQGFDSADFYFNFWTSEWVNDASEARTKIEKILLPNYNLAKVEIVDQLLYELPPHKLNHLPAQPENLHWWYKRRLGQWQSIQMAFNLIDQDYDMIIKFRLDGRLMSDLDVTTIDLKNNQLLFQDYARCGFDDFKICDLFTIGTYEGMKSFVDFADHWKELVPVCNPNWETDLHNWSCEHVLGTYMKKYNMTQTFGDFKFHINGQGRSRFTDKHYHHQIVIDPTSKS